MLSNVYILGEVIKIATGTIKWMNDNKDFGYITPNDGTNDIFFHKSAIKSGGINLLLKGSYVTYAVNRDGSEGPCAINVLQQ